MSKSMVTCLLLLALVWAPDGNAEAREYKIAIDGCTVLAQTIYAEVSSALREGPGRAGPWLIEQGQGEILTCQHVAITVSRAYTSAMLSAGIDVTWPRFRYDESGRETHCPQVFLSRCHPGVPTSTSSSDGSLAEDVWGIVAEAVMREMYNPMSSDAVSFRGNDLKLRLGLSLRTVGNAGSGRASQRGPVSG